MASQVLLRPARIQGRLRRRTAEILSASALPSGTRPGRKRQGECLERRPRSTHHGPVGGKVNQALINVEAERTVLGCVLLHASCLYRTLPLLQAHDFSLDSHRRIYHAITELAEAGKPVDD